MTKRWLCTLMSVAMIASLGAGTVCSAEEDTTFIVGFDAEYPPYGYMDDNGEYTGFDLELAQPCATCMAGSWRSVLLTGIPRIWS